MLANGVTSTKSVVTAKNLYGHVAYSILGALVVALSKRRERKDLPKDGLFQAPAVRAADLECR